MKAKVLTIVLAMLTTLAASADTVGVAGLGDEKVFYYVVQPGDCLWSIAGKATEQGSAYWRIIFENPRVFCGSEGTVDRGNLIRDPDKIYPGECFIIPDEWLSGIIREREKCEE